MHWKPRSQTNLRCASIRNISWPPEKQTSTTKTDRRPDCVTEIRMGNSVLTVSGFFKQGATDTAADKMMKVLEAEAATQKTAI